MRALVVHPGTQHAFQLAAELNRLNMLSGFHTGFAMASGGALERVCNFLPQSLQRRVANRRIEELPHSLVHLQPILEGVAIARFRQSGNEQGAMNWRNERFQRNIPSQALKDADVIIGFDTSSWILAHRCRELGKPLVMVQTTGHPDSKKVVYDDLAVRFPEWRDIHISRLLKVRQEEQEEHDGATLIVASSSFTRQTLVENGVAPAKIRVIPHGVDCELFSPGSVSGRRPFRFVFAGRINAEKGVPLLLEAWRQLKPPNVELWLVGPASSQIKALLPDLPGLRYLGVVPQGELPGILRQCDVFVFPSYFEGFGLVILQAMACGLPVITTSATAGPDLFSNGDGGWAIPSGDVAQLAGTMSRCLGFPEEVNQTGKCARRIAERFDWPEYGRRWLPVLEEAAIEDAATMSAGIGTQSQHIRMRGIVSTGSDSMTGEFRKTNTSVFVGPRVLLAHPGTQYSGKLAAQLFRYRALESFHTGIAIAEGGFGDSILSALPKPWRRRFANRRVLGVPPALIHLHPWDEGLAIFLEKIGRPKQGVLHARNTRFQKRIPGQAIADATAVIGFDTSGWLLAERCAQLGMPFILDQSIGHPDSKSRVFEQLRKRYPEWSHDAEIRLREVREAEQIEHDLAVRIVVPSSFARGTLIENGVAADKIRVNPFGVNCAEFAPQSQTRRHRMRFCFVGSISVRKGVPQLLSAWERLQPKNAELWLIGPARASEIKLIQGYPNVHYKGAVPHDELPHMLNQCDVFVFPSFFEGYAQVVPEAMACGLPVIATTSAGADIVKHGENGWLFEPGDDEALIAALEHCLMNPGSAMAAGLRARQSAEKVTWNRYGDIWMQILGELTQADATG